MKSFTNESIFAPDSGLDEEVTASGLSFFSKLPEFTPTVHFFPSDVLSLIRDACSESSKTSPFFEELEKKFKNADNEAIIKLCNETEKKLKHSTVMPNWAIGLYYARGLAFKNLNMTEKSREDFQKASELFETAQIFLPLISVQLQSEIENAMGLKLPAFPSNEDSDLPRSPSFK